MISPKLIFQWFWIWGSMPVKLWVDGAKFYKAGQFDHAARAYEQGLRENPKHKAAASAMLDLAYCYQRLGRLPQAEELLKKISTNHPMLTECYVRLARVKLYMGKAADSVILLRRAIHEGVFSTDIVSLLISSYIENDLNPKSVGGEIAEIVESLTEEAKKEPKLQAALARLSLKEEGEGADKGRCALKEIAEKNGSHLDAILAWSEELLADGKLEEVRTQIGRLLKSQCEIPRMYSILAESYLADGTNFEPIFAVQNAVKACQLSGWSSPRELHILAESYYQAEDKMGALLVASKALDLGRKQIGVYPRTARLQKLVETLQQSGTVY